MLKRFDDPYNDEVGGTVLEGYDTAQVCLNGHMINSMAEGSPQHNSAFCDKCGAKAITQCPKCKKKIPGYYHAPGVVSLVVGEKPPNYCHACGAAYPWIESRLSAAREYIRELDRLTENEKGLLSRSLDDLVRDTPNTTVAAMRFKRLMAKAGAAAIDGLKTILVEIVVEAAKQQVWG